MKKLLFSLLSCCTLITSAQVVNIMQTVPNAGIGNNMMSNAGLGLTAQKHFIFGYKSMMGGNFLQKFNTQGDTIFSRSLTTPMGYGTALTETSDGAMYAMSADDSLHMIKYSANGSAVWKRNLLLPAAGSWNGVVTESNGTDNMYFIGSGYWGPGGHALFGKIDSTGAPLFTRYIDFTSWFGSNLTYVYPISMRKTPAGNYLLLGSTQTSPGIPEYVFLMEFDGSGNVNWTKTCQTGVGNSTQLFTAQNLALAANGHILISGLRSGAGSMFMRLDATGNPLWAKSITDNCYSAQIVGLNNGDIALHMAHSNQVVDAVPKNMLSIIDPSGNIKLTRSFGSVNTGAAAGLGQDANGNVIGIGYASNNQEFFIYSMDTTGTSAGCYDIIASLPVSNMSVTFNAQVMSSTLNANPLLFTIPNVATGNAGLVKTFPNIQTSGVITPPLCHGTFGSVSITPSGGSSPYNYKWSNGTNSQNLLNVPGGIYSVRVADNTGCVVIDTFNVIEPLQLTATYTVSHVTCFGAQNGSINVTTTGGTPGYDYQWTTQAATEDLSGISGGFYQLTITDTNNCTKTLAVSVNEPQQLIAGIISSQNVKCHGACDGGLTGVASGGTPPYTYQWNNPGTATTTTVTGLCPGNYLFSVTDSKSCFTFANAVITEPAALAITSATIDALCGAAYGEASVLVTGGVSPYTYSWSSGSTNDTAVALYAGTYTVSANDANNCSISTTVNVGITTPVSELCLVTVDSLSSHNILMWDKSAFTNVDYFNIFREDITNNYTLIAAVDYDSLSEYHDYDTLMADPNITTKRYKISAVDTCGNESAKSNFHNTIFIAHNNGTFTWNTYTIQNSANPVTNYLLMRDDFSTGNWQQIGTTAGTQNILNDPNYSTFQTTANWRVETVWGISCTSTMRQGQSVEGTVVKSKSNITNNRVVGIAANVLTKFGMYPNPASETVTILADNVVDNYQAEITNALGDVVMRFTLGNSRNTISIADLANGVYNVKINAGDKMSTVKRLVVQR